MNDLFKKYNYFLNNERVNLVHKTTVNFHNDFGLVFYFRNKLNNDPLRAATFWKDFVSTNMIMLPSKPELIMSYTFKEYW